MKLHSFMTTPALVGTEFLGPSWATWRIIARLIDGDAALLDAAEQAIALHLTGRTVLPKVPPREVYVGAGRRSGKSRFSGLIGTWLASQDYDDRLAPGETAVIAQVAPDKKQAALLLDYCRGLVAGSESLRAEIRNETQESIEFQHRTRLEVATASYRTIRGRSLAGAVVDECAFLRSDDSALPDQELARALRPALLTLHGMLIAISSPHRKVGLLYDAYRKYFANDASDYGLYIQASSRELNPTLDEEAIAAASESDPIAGASEYGGLFRSDIASYLDDATIDRATVPNRLSLPRMHGTQYAAFCDPSAGRSDSFTLAVAHQEHGRVVLDCLKVVAPPFERPDDVVAQFAETLRSYSLDSVTGDNYAGAWVVDSFRKHGVSYRLSDIPASQIYIDALPLFTGARVELLDHARLLTELRLLERHVRAGARDVITHPRGAHDDCANSCCGALRLASKLAWSGRSMNGLEVRGEHIRGTEYDPFAPPGEPGSREKILGDRDVMVTVPWVGQVRLEDL